MSDTNDRTDKNRNNYLNYICTKGREILVHVEDKGHKKDLNLPSGHVTKMEGILSRLTTAEEKIN